jgi:hypothetical protein
MSDKIQSRILGVRQSRGGKGSRVRGRGEGRGRVVTQGKGKDRNFKTRRLSNQLAQDDTIFQDIPQRTCIDSDLGSEKVAHSSPPMLPLPPPPVEDIETEQEANLQESDREALETEGDIGGDGVTYPEDKGDNEQYGESGDNEQYGESGRTSLRNSPIPNENGIWGTRPLLDKDKMTYQNISEIVQQTFGLESLTPLLSSVQHILATDAKYTSRKWSGTHPKVRHVWL